MGNTLDYLQQRQRSDFWLKAIIDIIAWRKVLPAVV